MFHYRNHGADYGRALVGLQVPPEHKHLFNDFITGIGHTGIVDVINETENAVYKHFLK